MHTAISNGVEFSKNTSLLETSRELWHPNNKTVLVSLMTFIIVQVKWRRQTLKWLGHDGMEQVWL